APSRVPAAGDGAAAGGGAAARPPLAWPNGSIGEYTPVKSGGGVPCARSDAVDANNTHRSAEENAATVFDMMLSLICDYCAAGAACCPTTLPSARLTRVRRPVWLPSFAGLKSTVIVSPILRVVLDQPARTNWPGVRPSISHFTLAPFPSSTDRKIHTWGFVHFHSVTVPVSTITLSPSNAELLWCARTDVAVSMTAMTNEQTLIWRLTTSVTSASNSR